VPQIGSNSTTGGHGAFVSLARLVLIACIVCVAGPQELRAATSSRVKEIARIEGAATRTLVGYGLVIGLDGTGDGKQTIFTVQSMGNLLQNMGLTIDARAVKVKNVAAVMVTAEVSSYARPGSIIDVTVSSIGDASSLQGGTLLRTPIETSNGEVLGYAQGSVSIGGYNVQTGSGTSIRKNHATVGRVPGGATIELQPSTAAAINDSSVNLVLREPDVTTSFRMAEAISARFGNGTARAIDPQSVQLTVPESYRATGSVLGFLSELEGIEVAVDDIARVVLNERTGTIVVGGAVRILPVAISHGSLSIKVRSTPIISQPEGFGPIGSATVVVDEHDVSTSEDGGDLVLLEGGTSVAELAQALNTMGVTPRDMIAILQAMRTAGALQAEIVIQ
jgi:flagellar P-ring protein precursor FlgI